MASAIPFRRRPSGEPIDALSGARILFSSRGSGWDGVLAEGGENGTWETDRITVEGTYVARRGRDPGDVAQALGFSDQAHLTRLFRRRFGTTPGAVARELGWRPQPGSPPPRTPPRWPFPEPPR